MQNIIADLKQIAATLSNPEQHPFPTVALQAARTYISQAAVCLEKHVETLQSMAKAGEEEIASAGEKQDARLKQIEQIKAAAAAAIAPATSASAPAAAAQQ